MKKNYLYNVFYKILILIIPLITTPYISRALGVTNVGIYSYTYSIAYYFVVAAMLGFSNYGSRQIATVKDNKTKLSKEFWSVYFLQVFSSIIAIIAYIIYLCIFNVEYKFIASLQLIYIVSSIIDISWFYSGMEDFKAIISRNTIVKVLSLILIFICVKTSNDLWIYTLIITASTLGSNFILMMFLPKYIKLEKVTLKDVFSNLKPCLLLFIPVISVVLFRTMDKVMLGIMCNINEVGFYSNAEKITDLPFTITQIVGTVMLPRMSNLIANENKNEAERIIYKSMKFTMFLSFPMLFGLMAVAKDFAIVYFGSDFAESGILIQILSFYSIFQAWGSVIRMGYLIPRKKDKPYALSTFYGFIINLILNIIMIRYWGAIGACIATVVTEIFVCAYQTFAIRKDIQIKPFLKDSYRFIMYSIVMFIIIQALGIFIDNIYIRLIIKIIVAVMLYGILNKTYIFENLKFRGGEKINDL